MFFIRVTSRILPTSTDHNLKFGKKVLVSMIVKIQTTKGLLRPARPEARNKNLIYIETYYNKHLIFQVWRDWVAGL